MLKRGLKALYAALPFKQQVFSVLRLLPIPERIYRHLHFKGIITVRTPEGERFRMRHHGYMIENELFWKGLQGWERISLELWTRLCRRSDVILDIGANTGLYAVLAQAIRPKATIIAVEPVARVFNRLADNVALNNGGVRAVQAAVSDHSGTATLYDLPDAEHVLSVSLDPAWNAGNTSLRPVEVRSVTVDELVREAGKDRVDLLKIDVETHEAAVLRGFRDLLQRDRPSMLIEILNEDVARDVGALLSGLGYVYFNVDDRTWPPPRVAALSKSGHFNFLVCTPEVAAAIGL